MLMNFNSFSELISVSYSVVSYTEVGEDGVA